MLEAIGLTKAFGGIPAVTEASLEVMPGAVHALMGENGAGKSTLVRMLAGLVQPDQGAIRFAGKAVHLRHPHSARQLGIAMIHQELMGFAELTVGENLLMGMEPVGRFPGWMDRSRADREATTLLARVGIRLPLRRRLKELSTAQRQAVEIARALAHEAAVVIMDEPTSALAAAEVDHLFDLIRDLQRQGTAILYISHRMDEVFRIADTITVMRDGRSVLTAPAAEFDPPRLIELMVGRALQPATATASPTTADMVLEVENLGRRGRFEGVTFRLRRGEVLGLAGLMGSGRTDLANALYGLAPADQGQVRIHGRRVPLSSPRQALQSRVALVTEDRRDSGLVGTLSVAHNLTLAGLSRFCRGPVIDRRAEAAAVAGQMKALAIKAAHPAQAVRFLSGGNQQKVVLGKALLTRPDVLLLDEPTRGIDVGAKAEIHALIRQLAAAGKAILLVSSELPELLSLSHRLLVMRQGRIVAELPGARTSEADVLRLAMPVHSSADNPD